MKLNRAVGGNILLLPIPTFASGDPRYLVWAERWLLGRVIIAHSNVEIPWGMAHTGI